MELEPPAELPEPRAAAAKGAPRNGECVSGARGRARCGAAGRGGGGERGERAGPAVPRGREAVRGAVSRCGPGSGPAAAGGDAGSGGGTTKAAAALPPPLPPSSPSRPRALCPGRCPGPERRGRESARGGRGAPGGGGAPRRSRCRPRAAAPRVSGRAPGAAGTIWALLHFQYAAAASALECPCQFLWLTIAFYHLKALFSTKDSLKQKGLLIGQCGVCCLRALPRCGDGQCCNHPRMSLGAVTLGAELLDTFYLP